LSLSGSLQTYAPSVPAVAYTLIVVFGCASYVVGSRAIITGSYAPLVFSRVVWLLLSIISFAGVAASGSSAPAVLLAAVFLAGNAVICGLSFWKGTRGVGVLEYVCLAILAVSAAIWAVFDAPAISVAVSLLAHFVGGAPTYRSVWRDPRSESAGFWSLFFIASVLSLVTDLDQPVHQLIFPAYFVLFDGAMTVLSLRRNRERTTAVQ
jgi:hypothetical protein